MTAKKQFGDVSVLDTRTFVEGMTVGQEIAVNLEKGKTLYLKLKHISATNDLGTRDVTFDLNGSNRIVKVRDNKAGVATKARTKADSRIVGSVGAPMPGVVLSLKVSVGSKVTRGDTIAVLSAMKMETAVAAPVSGVVKAIHVISGEQLLAGDLIVEIEA